jgi:3-phytase
VANADDPAIWVNPRRPGRSVVVGTLKDGGLTVVDLAGRTLQSIPAAPPPEPGRVDGRNNNVDLVYDARVGGVKGDLAIVSDRGRDMVRTYLLDPKHGAPLRDVTAPDAPLVFSADLDEVEDQANVYGLAAWVDHGTPYVLVSRRSRTAVALLRLTPGPRDTVTYDEVDRIELPSSFRVPGGNWSPCEDPGDLPQVEGMVVDAPNDRAFLGQEDVGIWRVAVDRHGFHGSPSLIERVREFGVPATFDEEAEECVADPAHDPGVGGEHISADVEGLTIYAASRNRGYFLASSQGDDTYAVFADRGRGPYVGSFAIADGEVDGVQESDGAAVVNASLDRRFPNGLLVTQDGFNAPDVLDDEGEVRTNTNFKLTRWDDVARAFSPRLLIDTR